MSQAELFAQASWFDDFDDAPAVDVADRLRWYQREAVVAVMEGFQSFRSQLIVMATGLGKTEVFTEIASLWNEGPVLVLAHRRELVHQARDRIAARTGELVEVEMADEVSSSDARYVVASNDSMNQARLARLGKDRFGLVIQDEAHHSLAPTYRRALEFFGCPVLGVTATPDRGDEKALGQVYENVAYLFDIQQGIEAGYLVPVRARTVELHEIDISHVKASGGEGGLNLTELDEAMLEAVEGIVQKTLELEPNRRGIWFWPGVRCAEFARDRINHFRPGSCGFVSGETEDGEREETVSAFRNGQLQHLSGCMVFTEGFDAPGADLVVLGRPTKSRALATQMAGRGTRVLPGVVDAIHGRDGAPHRRAAIAASAKPDLMILDFVGNMGKHSLVSPTDILGGNYRPAELELAKKKAKIRPGEDQLALLEEARKELAALAKASAGKVTATVKNIDPFRLYNVKVDPNAETIRMRFGETPITPAQHHALIRWGLGEKEVAALTKVTAGKLITAAIKRKEKGLATFKQMRQLQKYGFVDPSISFERASAAMNYLVSKQFRDVDPNALHDIINHRR